MKKYIVILLAMGNSVRAVFYCEFTRWKVETNI